GGCDQRQAGDHVGGELRLAETSCTKATSVRPSVPHVGPPFTWPVGPFIPIRAQTARTRRAAAVLFDAAVSVYRRWPTTISNLSSVTMELGWSRSVSSLSEFLSL
ncbi:hypothetical protein BHE74_00002697, partial [Ensete ventricosum]